MKKLILVRHGQYDNSGHLNLVGQGQIKTLALKLKSLIVNGMSVIVLTSPSDRTYESAEIISKVFGVLPEKQDILLSEGMLHPMNLLLAYNLVKSKEKTDIIIVVTHFDYVADLPKYFSDKEWGIKLPSEEIGKGEAWIIDSLQKTLTLIK